MLTILLTTSNIRNIEGVVETIIFFSIITILTMFFIIKSSIKKRKKLKLQEKEKNLLLEKIALENLALKNSLEEKIKLNQISKKKTCVNCGATYFYDIIEKCPYCNH